jgi:hypothetical protein
MDQAASNALAPIQLGHKENRNPGEERAHRKSGVIAIGFSWCEAGEQQIGRPVVLFQVPLRLDAAPGRYDSVALGPEHATDRLTP